jgi:predicted Kef-type K+ transport protein
MNDLLWISPALLAGIIAARVGLPPMVGYLLCGFALNLTGIYDYERLLMIGNLGVTLLLFTVGLKLEVRSLFRPVIWAGSLAHAGLIVVGLGSLLYCLGLAGVQAFSTMNVNKALLIGFALSLSSTVFAVKILEEKGEYRSGYGQIAVGVMIMQDIFTVIFLAASTGKLPSVWALGLLALIPGRRLLHRLLSHAGHSGELQVLYGIALAFGSYALFNAVGVKGDLGALIVGTLLATHPLAGEVSKRLLGFKDLLLVGFFLSIGMSGTITWSSLLIALFLAVLVLIKWALFYGVFTRFKMRARNAWLASLVLSNYSEFGLIVGAVAVSRAWLSEDWLVTIALAMTFTIIAAAPINANADALYERGQTFFRKFQTEKLMAEDEPPRFGEAKIVIIGMGSLGTAVYDQLVQSGHHPVGMDNEPEVVSKHLSAGRAVVRADAASKELWESTTSTSLETGIVTFKQQQENLCMVTRVRERNPGIEIFAVARYADEVEALKAAGAKAAWDLYFEAGIGLADEVLTHCRNMPAGVSRGNLA